MRALLLPLALLFVLPGCLEFDGECEEVRAKIDWEPGMEAVHVDVLVTNLGLSTFDCPDVDACVEAVKDMLAPLPSGSAPANVTMRSLAQNLAEGGGSDIRVALERRGDLVDLRLTFSAVPNRDSLAFSGAWVVDQGPPGRTRPRVIVSLAEGDTFEPRAGERFVHTLVSIVHDSEYESVAELYLLPRHVRSVTITHPENPGVVPMLAAMPGLEEALEDHALLEPDRASIASIR